MALRRSLRSVLPSVVALVLALVLRVEADMVEPVGEPVRVNSAENANSAWPDVGLLADGTYVVVWSGAKSRPSAGADILAQRFSEPAQFSGEQFTANVGDYSFRTDQVFPRLCPFSRGGFGVVWENGYDLDGDDYGVFARITDEDGVPMGEDIVVPEMTTGWQTVGISMAAQPDGFVASWQDTGEFGFGYSKLFFQRFSFDAARLESPVLIASGDKHREPFAGCLATSLSGEILATWQENDYANDRTRVLGRVFEEDGTATGDAFEISDPTTDGRPVVPLCKRLSTDGAVIAWAQLLRDIGVFVRFVRFDGTFATDQIRVDEEGELPPGAYTRSVQVSPFPNGGVVAIWSRVDQEDRATLFGRIVDSSGNLIGEEFRIAASAGQNLTLPYQYGVATLDDAQFVVVWGELTDDEDRPNIRLQPFCRHDREVAVCGDATCVRASERRGLSGSIDVTDALAGLGAAVGLRQCLPCICDVNESGSVTALDALAILRAAVGLPVTLSCPECS